MKRFVRVFFCILSIAFVACLLLLHWSGFQKACLLGILCCNYKEVAIEGFQGGGTLIAWDKVLCKTPQSSLTVSHFKLKWHPWRLIWGRTLSVEDFYCNVDFESDCDYKKAAQIKQAGWSLKGNDLTSYSILRNLKSPVKLDITSATMEVSFTSKEISIKEGRLKIQDIRPGQTGTLRYSGEIVLPRSMQFVAQGEFSLQASQKGDWEKIRCYGDLNALSKGVRYPHLSFSGIIDGITSKSKEEIKAEVHCGPANDFLLSGEYVKDSNRVYDFKWQGFFDHSLLKFLNMTYRPVLSILTEGNCVFHQKYHAWSVHAVLSALGKQFEAVHPSLKSLPCLSFKAQLDADIKPQQIDLKQYKFILKEKGASRLFLDINSSHPLTYFYKNNKLSLPSKEDSQIFEINFYETPFEIFNPYLKQYGFQVAGNLQSGNINVGWDAEEKSWTMTTFQPIYALVRQLKKDNALCLKDVTLRLSEKCLLKHNFDEIKYDMNWVASDAKHVSFFKFSPKGYVNLKNKTILSEGSFLLDNSWGKDFFSLDPFGVKLNKDLLANVKYGLEYKEGKLLVNQLNLSLSSGSDKSVGMELKTDQPLYLSKKCWNKTKNGDMASFKMQNYPLDFVQYSAHALSGIGNGQFCIKKSDNEIQCTSLLPLNISGFKWCNLGRDKLSFNNILLDFKGSCDEHRHWSIDLGKFQVVSDDEKQALLSGNFALEGKQDKFVSSNGQVSLNLGKLSAQPLMLAYPAFVGDFNSHWIFDEKHTEANGRLHGQLLGTNFAIEAKSSYKRKDAEKPIVKSSLELQSDKRSSDIYVDTTFDKNGVIYEQVHSENLFLEDIAQYCRDLKLAGVPLAIERLIGQACSEKEDGSVANGQSKPMDTCGETEKFADKEIPFRGTMHLDLKSISSTVPFLEKLKGTVDISEKVVEIKDLQGSLCSGAIALKSSYRTKDGHFEISANGNDIDVAQLLKVPGGIGYPMNRYGQMSGHLDAKINLAGEIESLLSVHGTCSIDCKNGYYRIFNASNKAGQAIGGIASSLGLLLTANVSGMSSVGFLTSYIQGIPFNNITGSISRATGSGMEFKGSAINDDLAVNLDGQMGMNPDLTWAQQPLESSLQFSASERSPFLNYFSFDPNHKDRNGYYTGPNCKIGGTLGNPDYTSLVKWAMSARSEKTEPQKKASPVRQLLKNLF